MNQFKLAISGKARSGKNTIASMFIQHLKREGSGDKVVAIADPMKNIVKTMFPEALDDCLFGPSELRSNIIDKKYKDLKGNLLTYRQALIDLGALGRKYNGDIWLNCLVADADRSKLIGTYIVSDVRFLNEFNYLKNAGFTMIRILRNDSAKIDDPSELEQDLIPNSDFHYILHNDDSLDSLNEEVKFISHKLHG